MNKAGSIQKNYVLKTGTTMKEYCGLIGIYDHEEAARLAYFGLYAQQHRGQESAGITTWDNGCMLEYRGMGLVPDVFSEDHLRELTGNIAIGHVRYSTTGSSALRNAQPFMARHGEYQIAIAHNGNLVNAEELREKLEHEGAIFQTTADSEVFMHLIVRGLKNHSFEQSVENACREVRGAYSLVILVNDKLIALRDPHGIRPLALGRIGESLVVASETCAFDLLEAEFLRTVEPGEMVIIQGKAARSLRFAESKRKGQCIFELVYFARPDSNIFDENVYACRKEMGRQLAIEAPVDADFVMPFPDSGIYCAVGFAQAAGLPYEPCMIRNHYVGRTFIQPTQGMRDFSVRVKINPVHEMIKGKRIVIVDDSIVRGTTIRTRVRELRKLGATEVHCRISCPPVKYPCFYGVDFSTTTELLATKYSTVEDMTRYLELDSLGFLSCEGLARSVKRPKDYCMACFDGDYCVPIGKRFPLGDCPCSKK